MSEAIRPRLSIVIPVSSDTKIGTLLQSLEESNGFNAVEVVIVRNKATSSVNEITDQFSRRYANVRLVDTPIQGMSSSRNLGICQSTGDFIAHLDSDIVVDPNFLTEVNIAIDNNPKGEVFVPTLRRDRGTTVLQRLSSDHYTHLQERPTPPLRTPGLIVKRTTHEEVGGFNELIKNGQDAEFSRRIKWRNIIYIPAAIVTHVADKASKFIIQHFKYGRDKSIQAHLDSAEEWHKMQIDRLLKLLFLPKFLKNLKYGIPNALWEGSIGTIVSLGFWMQEVRFLINTSKAPSDGFSKLGCVQP